MMTSGIESPRRSVSGLWFHLARSGIFVLAMALVLPGCGESGNTQAPPQTTGLDASYVSRAVSVKEFGNLLVDAVLKNWEDAAGVPDASWDFAAGSSAWTKAGGGFSNLYVSDRDGSYEIRDQLSDTLTVSLYRAGVLTTEFVTADSMSLHISEVHERYVVDDIRVLDDAYRYALTTEVGVLVADGVVISATAHGEMSGRASFPQGDGSPLIYTYLGDHELTLETNGFALLCAGRVSTFSLSVFADDGKPVDTYEGTFAVAAGANNYVGSMLSRLGSGVFSIDSHRSCAELPATGAP